MKYIVIGLGYFGSSLATRLTALGHEVIGVDKREGRAQELKDHITKVMIMDSSKPNALESLPVADVDAVIVAIGEDIGSSILTLSLLKKMPVKRLIGRAINPIHQNILTELGIDETVHPEEDIAIMVSSTLMLREAVSMLQINDDYFVIEIKTPSKYIGHNLETIDMESRFAIKPIAIKIAPKITGLEKILQRDFKIDTTCDRTRPLRENDRLLVMGEMDKIKKFIEQ
jgi:trk system potassium uptake protein